MAEALTGRYRYRTNWRGNLILQVEHTYIREDMSSPICESYTVTEWRDAKVADVRLAVENHFEALANRGVAGALAKERAE